MTGTRYGCGLAQCGACSVHVNGELRRFCAVPVRPRRGVNTIQNGVYMACFIDEVVFAAGVGALEFRRKLMGQHPTHLAVLDAIFAARGKRIRQLPLKHKSLSA